MSLRDIPRNSDDDTRSYNVSYTTYHGCPLHLGSDWSSSLQTKYTYLPNEINYTEVFAPRSEQNDTMLRVNNDVYFYSPFSDDEVSIVRVVLRMTVE